MPTYKVSVNSSDWTLISSSKAGYLENQGPSAVKLRSSVTPPAPADRMGHNLGINESIGWSQLVGENVYAKTIEGSASIVITES